MNSKLTELYFKLSSLVIFRDILNCRTMRSLERLLKSLEDDDTVKQIQAYSDFVSNLYRHHNDLSSYILTLMLEDENIYMIRKAHGLEISGKMQDCLMNELEALQCIADMTSETVKSNIAYSGFLPNGTIHAMISNRNIGTESKILIALAMEFMQSIICL